MKQAAAREQLRGVPTLPAMLRTSGKTNRQGAKTDAAVPRRAAAASYEDVPKSVIQNILDVPPRGAGQSRMAVGKNGIPEVIKAPPPSKVVKSLNDSVAPKIPKTDDEIRSFLKEKIGSDVDADKAIGHWGRIEKRLKDARRPDTDSMLKSVMEDSKKATLKSGITPDMGRAYDAAISHHSIEKLKSFADSVKSTAPGNSKAIHHVVKAEATPPSAPPESVKKK
jgi:hypothetical protein